MLIRVLLIFKEHWQNNRVKLKEKWLCVQAIPLQKRKK